MFEDEAQLRSMQPGLTGLNIGSLETPTSVTAESWLLQLGLHVGLHPFRVTLPELTLQGSQA